MRWHRVSVQAGPEDRGSASSGISGKPRGRLFRAGMEACQARDFRLLLFIRNSIPAGPPTTAPAGKSRYRKSIRSANLLPASPHRRPGSGTAAGRRCAPRRRPGSGRSTARRSAGRRSAACAAPSGRQTRADERRLGGRPPDPTAGDGAEKQRLLGAVPWGQGPTLKHQKRAPNSKQR
jgi:hypothetical protein